MNIFSYKALRLLSVFLPFLSRPQRVKSSPPATARRTQDRTKLSQEQIDFVYESFHNLKDQHTQEEIATFLNDELGLNKSRSTYARIYHSESCKHKTIEQ